ncbi:uncharacterized protein LOC126745480 isoform X2 [Anthonomus grandis grandis]|uniref:uncharacterized protein LOC126745480 isoform X2 n=1 Tax=Anthonomus grandis grandis TaxID=2921223 RepID=UPI002165A67E|nr:uncharacterized protein LOC126745480 isoform X2 [Anthonomus grandis grandis]
MKKRNNMESGPEKPKNSIVLSVEDLTRLGVKVDSLPTASGEQLYNEDEDSKQSSHNKNNKSLKKNKHSKNKISRSDKALKTNLVLSQNTAIDNTGFDSKLQEHQDKFPGNKKSHPDESPPSVTKNINEAKASIMSNNLNSSSIKRRLESSNESDESTPKKSKKLWNKIKVQGNSVPESSELADTKPNLNESSLATSEIVDPHEENTDVPKKGRKGRPCKVDNESKFEIPLFDTFPSIDMSEVSGDKVPKKKRGRPRKNPLSEDECEIAENKEPSKIKSAISIEGQDDAESSAITDMETEDDDAEENNSWKFANEDILQQILNDEMVKSTGEKGADGSAKKGRRPKFSKDLEDADGTSICAVCNESMPNGDWLNHRMQVHYNLTWRKGDLAIDVADQGIVQKAFKEVKTAQKYLQCFKCSFKTNNVNDFGKHLEACYEIVKDGHVTCAVCNRKVSAKTWHLHRYMKHNNLAWRIGDTPLDLQDKSLVLRIFQAIYKSRKPLRCEICNLQKKSTMGYISHKVQCIASLSNKCSKVSCELCGRYVLPVSMEYHMKQLHNTSNESALDKMTGENFPEDNLSGPRKAAENALEVIQKISNSESKMYCLVKDCEFRNYRITKALKNLNADLPEVTCLFPNCDFKCLTDKMYTIAKHLDTCPYKPMKHYICKSCLVFFEHELEAQTHCQDMHKAETGGNDDLNFVQELEDCKEDILVETEQAEKGKLRGKNRVAVTKNPLRATGKPLFLSFSLQELPSNNLVYYQAFPWMYSFCEKNFNNPNLFENFRNNRPWQVLDCDLLNKYLPHHHESCDISVRALDIRKKNPDPPVFRKMDLFESCSFYEGEATIFCGGPITAMAWMPTPYNIETMNQIVAVAVTKNAEAVYNAHENYNEPCIIQFWNCGPLNSQQSKPIAPELLYGLALNAGPVWDIEWCPSGCLDIVPIRENEPSRLGLLAVATCDSLVYIYSVDDVKNEDDRGVIYKADPLIKLQLRIEKCSTVQDYYATKISWTKASEHRYVAVGYSNGIIALYNLLSYSASPLFHSKESSGPHVIFSCNSFQAHSASVTGLVLNNLLGGNRWCCSTSSDKTLIFWDLESNTVQSESGCLKKFGLSDVVWPTLWPVVFATKDEANVNKNTPATIVSKSIRNCYVLRENTINISDSICGLRAISFSDWLNAVLFGGTSGEVSAQFTQRLIHGADRLPKRKNVCLKYVFSNTKLTTKTYPVDLSKEVTYENIIDQYAIEFRDFNSKHLAFLPSHKDKTLDRAEIDSYNIHKYPLNAVNKLATNPNCQAYPYYAVGYQAGFLRIRSIECLKTAFKPLRVPGHDFAMNF